MAGADEGFGEQFGGVGPLQGTARRPTPSKG